MNLIKSDFENNNIINQLDINKLPNEILYEIIEKCDTSSILNLNKTNKLFNSLIKDDFDDNKIIELESETFQLELMFYLKINQEDFIKLDSSLNNIYNYIQLITFNYEWSDNLNDNQDILFSLRMNIITYDIIKLKLDFNRFVNDYNLYDILMKSEKEFELLTYVSKNQIKEIEEYKKNNIKFKFNGVGNKNEYDRIYNIINQNLKAIDLKSFNNLKWLNMETALNNINVIKKLIGLNMDLTII